MLSPIDQRPSLAAKRDADRIATVTVLPTTNQPYAIAWTVIAVGVLALNGMLAAGGWSHVGKKRGEAIPAFANANSTTAVVVVNTGLGVVASLSHALPNAMLKRATQSVSPALFVCSELATAATFGISAEQVSCRYRHDNTAFATAEITSAIRPNRIELNNRESRKYPAFKIDSCWHGMFPPGL